MSYVARSICFIFPFLRTNMHDCISGTTRVSKKVSMSKESTNERRALTVSTA